jgi:SufS family cysteine desulfurase
MKPFNAVQYRENFPALATFINQKPLVYFDNAATTQKPHSVIDCYQQYYKTSNANVHRGSHALGARATTAFEKVRKQMQQLLNAKNEQEIIWTKGATESINLVAQSWGRNSLKVGDEILLSQAEHHANIVPWQIVAQQTGAVIKVLPLTDAGIIDVAVLDDYFSERTRIVCCNHISNVVGKINPIECLIATAKKYKALTLIDGAQAMAHLNVDVQTLDCDFYVCSAHKMYGPTGVGILYGKTELLTQMPPYQSGGEMIKSVSFEHTTFNDLPYKFEAGTPNIAGVVAFGVAIKFIKSYQNSSLIAHERLLCEHTYRQLTTIDGLEFIVSQMPDIPLFSFTLNGHHNHDIAAGLDSVGIAVRSGHHCAMPLMQYLEKEGCIRISLAPYNTLAEVDYTIAQLRLLLSESNTEHIDPIVINDEESIIIKAFSKAKSWDSKHREIMLLGKQLPRLAITQRTETHLINGCESLAWLVATKAANGIYTFSADSDAKIIRGLLMIVFAGLNHKTAAQIRDFDIEQYFTTLGLLQHLSPSRGNGLHAIVQKIYLLIDA